MEFADFFLRRRRADQHTIASGIVDFLDHQLL